MASARFAALETALIAAGIPATAARESLSFDGPMAVLLNTKVSSRPVEQLLLSALPELEGAERDALELRLADPSRTPAEMADGGKRLKFVGNEIEKLEARWLDLGTQIDEMTATAD